MSTDEVLKILLESCLQAALRGIGRHKSRQKPVLQPRDIIAFVQIPSIPLPECGQTGRDAEYRLTFNA